MKELYDCENSLCHNKVDGYFCDNCREDILRAERCIHYCSRCGKVEIHYRVKNNEEKYQPIMCDTCKESELNENA